MHFSNFNQLIDEVKSFKKKRKVVVVCAEDKHTLEAVIKAQKDQILEPILVGKEDDITLVLQQLNMNPADYKIINECEKEKAAYKAIELIKNNEADFLMKGQLDTKTLLKAVVDKNSNLRTGHLMSHFAIFQIPNYHKLIAISDTGMVMYPDLEQKTEIVKNMVDTFLSLGYECPKIAVLAAVEKINPKMQETIDAAELKNMNKNGEISNCVIEGPVSYDIVMDKESARIKGFNSPVVGDADILIVPNITVGNILGKGLVYSAGAKMAGFIVGAKVPIVLTSRGSSTEEKYLSLALSAAAVK